MSKEIVPSVKNELSVADTSSLEYAVRLLNTQSFAMNLASLFGKPIDFTLSRLPGGASVLINKAVSKALRGALDAALFTMNKKSPGASSSNVIHKLFVAATGGGGGFFGLPALAVELPVTTGIMLRSIADIARSEGENLDDPEARLACVEVFGLEGGSPSDDDADIGYYMARIGMSRMVDEALRHMAASGSGAAAHILMRLGQSIASRFGVAVTEKVMVQTLPIVGAIGGAAVNLAFINYYQNMAQGHFIIRRLERIYGESAVRRHYDLLAKSGVGFSESRRRS